MCGIYAVRGQQASQRVFAGLKRLEYRGYDSWGIAAAGGDLVTHKQVGEIPDELTHLQLDKASVAVGHTRWATHGKVSKINAHPHSASDDSFVVVHNGVVENYQTLKQQLINRGASFTSQTDTEVIVKLLEAGREQFGQNQSNQPDLTTIIEVFSQLKGRNTFAVLRQDGGLLAVRQGSPLIIGKNDQGDYFLSSDTLSVAPEVHQYLTVKDGQAVAIIDDQIRLVEVSSKVEQPVTFKPLALKTAKVDHDGFPSFMQKEIHDQASVLTQVLQNPPELFAEFLTALNQARQVWLTGAGSAYYAAGQIALYLRQVGLDARAIPAYEARSYINNINQQDLLIAVSQSGETADTLEVIEWAQDQGVKLASIVNMAGSSITQRSDFPLMLKVGPEVAVASTKAFIGQVVWGKMVATCLNKKLKQADLTDKVADFEQQLSKWLANDIVHKKTQKMASALQAEKHVFLLGRGQLYFAALEAALKLKEVSYLHAEGFSGGELKHGVLALVEQDLPVFVLAAGGREHSSMLNAAAEVSARGGQVIGVSPDDNQLFDQWLPVPTSSYLTMPAMVVPFQLLTCLIAEQKGINPDKPRNLAKSVTVK